MLNFMRLRHTIGTRFATATRAASAAPTINIPDDKLFLEYVSEKWASVYFNFSALLFSNVVDLRNSDRASPVLMCVHLW